MVRTIRRVIATEALASTGSQLVDQAVAEGRALAVEEAVAVLFGGAVAPGYQVLMMP